MLQKSWIGPEAVEGRVAFFSRLIGPKPCNRRLISRLPCKCLQVPGPCSLESAITRPCRPFFATLHIQNVVVSNASQKCILLGCARQVGQLGKNTRTFRNSYEWWMSVYGIWSCGIVVGILLFFLRKPLNKPLYDTMNNGWREQRYHNKSVEASSYFLCKFMVEEDSSIVKMYSLRPIIQVHFWFFKVFLFRLWP